MADVTPLSQLPFFQKPVDGEQPKSGVKPLSSLPMFQTPEQKAEAAKNAPPAPSPDEVAQTQANETWKG